MVVSMNKVTFDEDTLKLLVEEAVELAVQQEREACANAMAQIVMTPTLTHGALVKLSDVVNAIRARGQA